MTPHMAYRDGHVVITGVLGTLWMLSIDRGVDERFEADCRYAAAFHDVPLAELVEALKHARAAAPAASVEEPAFDGEEP